MKKVIEFRLVKVSLILLILFCAYTETTGQTDAPSEAPTESSPPSVVPTDAPSFIPPTDPPTPTGAESVTNDGVQFTFNLREGFERIFEEDELEVLEESLEQYYTAALEDNFDYFFCDVQNMTQSLETSNRDIRQRQISSTVLSVFFRLAFTYANNQATPTVDPATLASAPFSDPGSEGDFVQFFSEQITNVLGNATSVISNIAGGLNVLYNPPTSAPDGTETNSAAATYTAGTGLAQTGTAATGTRGGGFLVDRIRDFFWN